MNGDSGRVFGVEGGGVNGFGGGGNLMSFLGIGLGIQVEGYTVGVRTILRFLSFIQVRFSIIQINPFEGAIGLGDEPTVFTVDSFILGDDECTDCESKMKLLH